MFSVKSSGGCSVTIDGKTFKGGSVNIINGKVSTVNGDIN